MAVARHLLLVAALQPTAALRISRAVADANFLFPSEARRLTRFMMDAQYGPVQPFTGGWMQRGVLDAAADSDFFARMAYYADSTEGGRPRGAIFVAERDDGSICGFADIGASLWLPNDRTFRLPLDDDLQRLADTGIGTDGLPKPGVSLCPYISNVVVDASLRRSGIGRQLMAACEEEASRWADHGSTSADIWLEVTSTNERALAFYGALGYAAEGCTVGSEVQREGADGGFAMKEVERCLMRKAAAGTSTV